MGVGPGCCRPVVGDYINLVQNSTRNGCAMECASNTCNAFAISGCSSSSDQTCGGACHLYLIDQHQEKTTDACTHSALDGNTFCYSVQLTWLRLRRAVTGVTCTHCGIISIPTKKEFKRRRHFYAIVQCFRVRVAH